MWAKLEKKEKKRRIDSSTSLTYIVLLGNVGTFDFA